MVGLPLRNNNRSLMPSLQVLLLPLACVASAAAATDEQSRQGSRVQQPDDAATTATSQGPEDSRSRRLQEAAGGPSAQAVLLDLKADLEAGWTHNLLESWTAETVSSPLLRHVLGGIAFGSQEALQRVLVRRSPATRIPSTKRTRGGCTCGATLPRRMAGRRHCARCTLLARHVAAAVLTLVARRAARAAGARRFLQNLPMTRMGRKKAQRLYSVGIKELFVTPKGFRLE